MGKNIVTAVHENAKSIKTTPVYQWNYGMILELVGFCGLPEVFEVQFSNDKNYGKAQTSIGENCRVPIPDSCLTEGRDIWAWLFLHETETDGETVYMIQIPVIKRSKTENPEPTPEQEDVITQAIAALNNAVQKTGEAEERAEEAADRAQEILDEFEEIFTDGLVLDDGDASDLDEGTEDGT